MAMNRWMAGPSAPVPAGAAVRLLRGQQSVERFAAREKHRFLITKVRLLRTPQWRGRAAVPRRRDVEFDAIARDALLPDQQRISRPAASRSSRRGISM
ncbi:hypothetical protein [Burkholderia cenocepacia]|uniref:hypothetical protein n=1 Tax=Burkholderia cenocepacia TaxID=95486 RepID=UPI001B8ED6EF|nr:hypothetical protein [Burkholderia cenocepacia]MBR7968561.1 hypothetical protein [Burkholderia cenocepacia]